MKIRALFVTILTIAYWVSGCTAKLPTQPVTHSFCCELSVQGNDASFAGTLTVNEQSLLWELTSPTTVAGYTLSCNGTTVTLTPPDGDAVSTDAATLPADGAIPVLWNVLRTADPTAVRWENGDGYIGGRITGGRYELLCDSNSGLPKKLTLNGDALLFVFSNAQQSQV